MKKLFSNSSISAKFALISSLFLLALFLVLAYSNFKREKELIIKGAVNNARMIASQIVETRDYLSRVVTSEPEQNSSLIPQVAASSIAKHLTQGSGYYVRQVSLRYRNPDNRPDDFEASQLSRYRDGSSKETWEVVTKNTSGQPVTAALRYMMPMTADQSCLTCHGSFETAPRFVRERFPKGHSSYGYSVGEVIGAVSVSVPLSELYRDISSNMLRDLLYEGALLILFIAVTAAAIHRLIITPVRGVATGITSVARTGDFSQRLTSPGSDEIGELVGSFNELMSELERKTIQRKESEERYRNFIEIAQSPIVTFMADGKIVISNSKAEQLFGMERQELLGQEIFDFLEDGERLRQAIEAYFNNGASDMLDIATRQRVRDVRGRLFEVEMVISVSQAEQAPIFTAILRATG